MAAGVSDGAIIIDTSINNSGAIKGAKQLERAVKGLENSINTSGKRMADGANTYVQAMNRARSAAKGLTGDQRSISREITKTESALDKLNAKQEKMRALADQRAQEQRDQLREQMIEETKAAIGHGNWEIMPKWSQDQALEQTMRDFEGRLAAIQSEPFENTDSWRSLQYDIDQATAKLEGLRSRMAELTGEAQTEVAPALEEAIAEPAQVASENLQKYARLMSDWSATMQEDSWNATPINDESAMLSISRYINTLIEQRNEVYHNTIASIEEAASASQEALETAQQITNAETETAKAARNTASANAEAAQAAHETASAEDEVAQNAQRAQSAFQRGGQSAINQWNQMPSVMRSVGQYLTTIGTAATHPAQALDRLAYKGIQGFVKMANAAVKAEASIVKMAGGGALNFLRKLASGAKNAAIQLAKLAGAAVAKGFKGLGGLLQKAGTALLGFRRETNSSNDGLKQGLMMLLRYGLGIRGLFALFRRLRSAISDGLGEIAKRSPEVNKSLNMMKSALNGLKASLGTAFAPIATAVAPALTKLINMLTSAINTIGAFIAALTGQRAYQKAVGGLNATGSAASGAAGEVEKLNRQLGKFDDLDVLKGNDDSSSGGGGGGGGGGGLSYTTEEISSGITDFVGKLKELWANADYEGIGREIAGAINGAFEKAKELISWENLEEPVTNAVNAITGIINGLVDGIDWELIGETFGEGINTIVNTLNLLLDGIDWENIGKGFATGLNGLVDTVDWDNLGKLFGKKLNAIVATIKGAVENFDWGEAGKAFAKAINSLTTTVKWTELGGTFASLINGTVAALGSAIEAFEWGEAGKNFAKAVNKITTTVKWAELGGTFAELINGTIDAMKSAIETFEWSEAGKNFAKAVNKITTEVKWAELGGTFAELINGTVDTMKSAVETFEWSTAGENFAKAVNKITTEIKWAELGGTFAGLINGAVDTMKSAVETFEWGEAGKNFGKAVNKLSTEVKWAELGGTFASLINGSVGSVKSAVEAFDWGEAGKNFASAINKVTTTVKWAELGGTLAELIDSPLSALRSAVENFSFGDAATGFAEAVNGFFENEKLWEDAATIVSDSIKGLFTWGTDFLSKLDVNQISNDIKIALNDVDWEGIGKAIFDFLVQFIKTAGNLIWELLTDFPDYDDYQKELQDWIDGVVEDAGDTERNYDVKFGLHPYIESEAEAIAAINQAINDGLETGTFTFPIGLDVPPETVVAASETFVNLWNNAHPEAPVYYNVETGKIEPLAKEIMEDEDKTVTTKEDLKTGKEDASALKTRDDKSETVTVTEDLKKGTENASALKTRDDKNETVTVTENLKKGTENASALKTRDDKSTTVTTTENLAKGKEDASAKKTRDSKNKNATTTENLKKGSENASAVKSRDAHDQKVTTTVKVAKGSVDKKAYKAITAKNNTVTTSVKLTFANVASGIKNAIKTLLGLETGGVLANGVWHSIPQYAGGTLRAGSIFAAGERGPELVGHIGGRTEVLNKSQLASTMFSAVENGMLSAISRLNFRMPAMATGSVLPYDVSAQIAKTGDDIMGTLNANNEDLIQTIISVAGQLVAAVQNTGRNGAPAAGGLTVDEMIRQINQRTQMLGRSPLLG